MQLNETEVMILLQKAGTIYSEGTVYTSPELHVVRLELLRRKVMSVSANGTITQSNWVTPIV